MEIVILIKIRIIFYVCRMTTSPFLDSQLLQDPKKEIRLCDRLQHNPILLKNSIFKGCIPPFVQNRAIQVLTL